MRLGKKYLTEAAILFFLLEAVFLFSFKIVRAQNGLVINEIMYDLPGADEKNEWLEIYNNGSQVIDLTGFKINDGDDTTNHAFNAPPKNGSRGSLILAPGDYLLLSSDAQTLAAQLTNWQGALIDTTFNLPNSSGTLEILDKTGQKISTAIYSKNMGGNGNGKSLEWDGTNFKESTVSGGTPGTINSVLAQSSAPPAALAPKSVVNAQQVSPTRDTAKLDQKTTLPTPSLIATNSPVRATTSAALNNTAGLQSNLGENQAQQLPSQKNKTLLWFLGILIFSLIVAAGLIHFKRQKNQSAVRQTADKNSGFF